VLGEFDLALQAIEQAQRMGERTEDARLQTFAAWSAGWAHATRGACDDGITACQRALSLSSDPLNTPFAMGWLGYAYLEKRAPREAIPMLEQAAQRLRQYRYHRLEGLYTLFLAAAQVLQNDFDKADFFASRGFTLVRDEQYRYGIAWAQRVLGHIALGRDEIEAAQDHCKQALSTFAALPARFEMGRAHLDLADLAQRRDQRKAITFHLTEAYQLFSALNVPAYIERATQRASELGLTFAEPPGKPQR
jgi:tetratricopeptide (TPR) repeat protein